MLCLACRYKAPGIPATEPRPYAQWFSGTDLEVFNAKHTFITKSSTRSPPIQRYFAGFELWLNRIQNKLHSGYKRRPRYSLARSSQPGNEDFSDDEDPNFDWNTLNQRASYTTMRSIMSSFEGKSLETRWASWNRDH
ncbi:hypothetical protein F5050DRAFT_1795604 [Lentinula boryana]|uniref:Uncharacterized protein n=1 Tax=Lentinula boryana TaxID=40481 RepID=A0ABQ8PWR0_9AGAR|nr:hypothetical protein F5050DRAFT_1795604 [Lentinula boryana]